MQSVMAEGECQWVSPQIPEGHPYPSVFLVLRFVLSLSLSLSFLLFRDWVVDYDLNEGLAALSLALWSIMHSVGIRARESIISLCYMLIIVTFCGERAKNAFACSGPTQGSGGGTKHLCSIPAGPLAHQ